MASTPSKPVKPIQERVTESLTILNKLKELGVHEAEPGYKELSGHFNTWIRGGEVWQGTVDFVRYNRRAKVLLPTKPGTIAKCDFLHYDFTG